MHLLENYTEYAKSKFEYMNRIKSPMLFPHIGFKVQQALGKIWNCNVIGIKHSFVAYNLVSIEETNQWRHVKEITEDSQIW